VQSLNIAKTLPQNTKTASEFKFLLITDIRRGHFCIGMGGGRREGQAPHFFGSGPRTAGSPAFRVL